MTQNDPRHAESCPVCSPVSDYRRGYAQAIKDVVAWNSVGERLVFDDPRFGEGYESCRQDLAAYCRAVKPAT